MIKRRPRINALVAGDVLGGLQREAAREYPKSPEYRLLVGGQQRVAPFEGRAQCLMATRTTARRRSRARSARAAPASFDAEQQPRGAELDRRGMPSRPTISITAAKLLAVRAKRGSTPRGFEELDRAGRRELRRATSEIESPSR
jgi:hypothetical protein